MSRITESRDVQNQLINFLQGIGWTFIERYSLLAWRGNDETQHFLIDILRTQLAKLNSWAAGDARVDEVIRRLRMLPATLEGNEQFAHAVRGHWTTYDAAMQRERNVVLIDYDHMDANTFHFTEEMWVQDREHRRLDMVLFVNGLPVVLVENKSPKLEDPGLTGFKDVQEVYTQTVSEFIKYPVPFAICATRLEYGATWNPSLKAFYKWKVNGRDFGLEDLSKSFFAHAMVLSLLRDYTIFYRMDDALQKFLLRPHQMRAVEKIVVRCATAQADANAPVTGLESHTQGSGKTLTMIVAAHLLRRHPALASPTILIVVDRIELETQMLQNLQAFGLDAVRAESREALQRLLAQDTRGVIVTTIHKFDGISKNLIVRRNVVVLVDEAHRSQEGDLGTYLRAALPNALRFGFTGTPIDKGKVGMGTYKIFGAAEDPNGTHDEYTINESIADGTTLPLNYMLAPTKIWLDRPALEGEYAELLAQFWRVVDDEGAESQEALSRLLQRADKLLAVLKAPERIAAVAAHIAQHFQENVMPLGFKGIVVAPDREACAIYKAALDQLLPKDWSVVVYSADSKKDSEQMRNLYLEDDAEKRVRKAFRDPHQQPQLLIVTQKLLTGFDAPVAYVMYLDKPLKDHTLLQAIARVNRPYPDKKSGLVVDYIGVFTDLQRALSGQQEKASLGLIDYETLKPRFTTLLAVIQTLLDPIQPHNATGRTERIVEYFFDEGRRDSFFKQFKDLQMVYEVISPDPFLRDYLDEYALVADIYATTYSYFDPKAEQRRLENEFLHKTEQLIQSNVYAYEVAAPLPLYPINRNLADVIAQDHISDRVKVINLQRSIIAHIQDHIEEEPYLATISDEVERVIEQLHQRQISVEAALATLQTKADQVVTTSEDRATSNLDKLAFGLRMVVRGANLSGVDDAAADTLATSLADYLNENAGWQHSGRLESQVRMELWRRILPLMPQPIQVAASKQIVDELLRMHSITL